LISIFKNFNLSINKDSVGGGKMIEELKMLSPVEKYILMLLYANDGKVRGKLWLQKEIFILSRAFEELAEELDFEAYSYGPYSEALEEYRNALENSGLIAETQLTEQGKIFAGELWKLASDREKDVIKATVEFLEGLDREELLLYIYVMYPDTAEKSDERDRILKNRKKIALKMLRDGKVSLSLAAKLAGLSVEEMTEEAIKHGIKPFDAQVSG
jgi:uncharacterized protein YwgA